MTHSYAQAHSPGLATATEPAPGILPWLAQYPNDLDDYWLEVRCIHGWRMNPKTDKPLRSSKYFRIRDVKKKPGRTDDHVITKIAKGYNVFLLRNPVYRRQRRSSKACDVARITSFALDLDTISAEEALVRMREAGLPQPSLAVFTGHGVHAYFYLRYPLSARRGSDYLREFVAQWSSHPALSGLVDKKVHDPARILRLTSINYKDLCVPPGGDPPLAQHRDYITMDHLARVIEDHSELQYDLPDLITSIDHKQAMSVLESDIRVKADQDSEYTIATRITKATPNPYNPSSPSHFYSYRLVSDGERCGVDDHPRVPLRRNTDREVEGLDLDYVEFLVERIPVIRPKGRHVAIAKLVAQLRKSYDALSDGQKRLIHSLWYARWRGNMSGQHDEESSLQDFVGTWENLPRNFPGNGEWLDDVLAKLRPHPLRALAQTDDERKIADVLWTGRGPEDRCFLSCRVAAKALGKGRDTASRVLRSVVRLGIADLVEKGTKATGHASIYRVASGGH